MGRTHGMSGVLAGVASVAVVGDAAVDQATWVAVVAGTALLPDLDMPHSTIGRMWGPITRGWGPLPGVSQIVKNLAGGHRKGTHCWIGIGTHMLLVLMSSWWAVSSAVLVAICTGLVILAVDFIIPGRMHWRENLAVSAAVGVTCYMQVWTLPWWLAVAVGTGMLVHCLGDEITRMRVPWLWPIKTERMSTPDKSWWRIRTGGRAEQVLLVLISAGCVLLLIWRAA